MLEREVWLWYAEYDLNIAKQALYGEYRAIPKHYACANKQQKKP